jgi:HAD superfamily hydrolase (TIGR01509 family)
VRRLIDGERTSGEFEIPMSKGSTEERVMKLKLPAGKFAAYLFDCDGTIADSMPLHYVAWKKTLAENNCDFPETLFYEWGGMPTDKIVAQLNKMHGLNMSVEHVVTTKERRFYDLLPTLKVIPEVLEHIDDKHGRIPFAVVSGGTRESVSKTLTILGLLDRFPILVCADDYTRGKPDPQAYLMAAEQLGVAPARCLVFEDTELGIQAARAAGMQWVKIPAPWERNTVA